MMKKILKALAVTGALVSMSSGVAFADISCSITGTGVGSVNTCYNDVENHTVVTCTNKVDVDNDNDQNSSSGSATVEGNVSGGNATSGSASNTNLTDIAVQLGCGQPASQPETPSTPAVGGGGGGGGGAGQLLGEQVSVKPVGGAGAGSGTAVNTDTTAATAGILGSAGLVALGVALRKRAFNL